MHDALAFADAHAFDAEVIVVDNGSTDASGIAATAAGARVIDEPVRGYGSAIRAGIRAARNTMTVIADADGQHDLGETGCLLEQIDAGADIVIGRRIYDSPRGASGWIKSRVGAPALSSAGRLLTGAPITDFHCGFRAAKTDALRSLDLRCDGMEFASEMIVRAHRAGLRLAEAHVTAREAPDHRTPHLRPVRDGLRHLACLIELSGKP